MRQLFAFLFLCSALAAQTPVAAQPAVLADATGAWVYYADGTAQFVDLQGQTLATITSSDKDEFVTRWPDRNNPNITHEVRTPHGGKTTGARKAALERHRESVALMQEAFPPPTNGS